MTTFVSDRIQALSNRLAQAADARAMCTAPWWDGLWNDLERELVDRLLKTGPTEEMVRWKLQVAVETARRIRRAIENGGQSAQVLERELDYVEGRKPYPVA